MSKFARPRLVTFDDPAYQRHVGQMKLERANNRPMRPPSQRDLFGGEAEALIREQLGARFQLGDRRILEYDERIGGRMRRKYRELDAIVVDSQASVVVWEIKASRRSGSLHRALRQLRDTKAILSLAFRSVVCGIIFVDTGTISSAERALLAATKEAPERLPQTLDEAIAEHAELRPRSSFDELRADGDGVELLVLTVSDIVVLSGDRPLSLAWDEDEIDECRLSKRLPACPACRSRPPNRLICFRHPTRTAKVPSPRRCARRRKRET